MEMRIFILQFICISLFFFSSILWISKSSIEKPWLYFQLITSSCSLSDECIIFNVTCYSNGKIIFYGINNTAYIGKKIFQLSTNRLTAVNDFIQIHSHFKSIMESENILFHIQFSYNINEKYFWKNDSSNYIMLTSILMVDTLACYKKWSILLRTAHMLANIQQKKQSQKIKRSISIQYPITSFNLNPLIISDIQRPDDNNDNIPIRSNRKREILLNDDLCFSSLTFDLVDACLSINDIIGINQFYPLHNQLFNELQATTPSNNTLISAEYESTTSQSISHLTSTDSGITHSTTLNVLETTAINLVNDVENNLNGTESNLNHLINQAQTAIDMLPNTSSVKVPLQNKLNNLKASIVSTTVSDNGTSETVVTASPSNETSQTTASITDVTTLGSSNETSQTTVSLTGTTTLSSSSETSQTTTSITDVTTLSPSNEPSQTTASITGVSTLSSSNETSQTTVSLTGTTTISPSSETLATTIVEAESTMKSWSTDLKTSVVLTTMDNSLSNNEETTDVLISSSISDNSTVGTTMTQTVTTTLSLNTTDDNDT